MGSILRSYRFLKCLSCSRRTSFTIKPVSKACRNVSVTKSRNLFILSCHQFAQSLPKVESSDYREQINSLDKTFYKLDLDARKYSRLYSSDVEGILNTILQLGNISSNHALLLIRCCGALLADEPLDFRIALTNNVWNTFTKMKCKMDVSHYNALLKVYLENEQPFLPTDFLASMELNGIEPNRVTFQRLVTKYCEDGDIAGASKILEFMKEKNLPVNEMVFNSLVMGHTKTGDMTGAHDILDVMKNSKLDPSARTYSALACGYAQSGDIEGLHNVLKEAETNQVFLLDEDYLDIIVALAVNGHSQHVAEISDKLPKMVGYVSQCIGAILELVNKGHADIGFSLVKTLPRSVLQDGENAPSGNFFLRQLVKTNAHSDQILHYCREMKNLNLNDLGLSRVTEYSLKLQKPDLAILLLKEMKKEGQPVRSHYFWPVLKAVRDRGDEATYNILKLMAEMECPITYDTYSYAFPNLNTNDPEGIVQRMTDMGQPTVTVVTPLVEHLLTQNSVAAATKLIECYPVRLNASFMLTTLATECRKAENTDSFVKILKHLIENPDHSIGQRAPADYCGQFIYTYLADDVKAGKFLDLLKKMKAIGFKISYSSLEVIQGRLRGFENQQKILETLESMASNNFQLEGSGMARSQELSIQDLEAQFVDMKSQGLNAGSVLRRLLLAHCRARSFSRAIELENEMKSLGIEPMPSLCCHLMDMFAVKDDLEEALRYKEMIDAVPEFIIDDVKLMNLAALFVRKDRISDAKNLVLNHKERLPSRENRNNSLDWSVAHVLQAAAAQGNVEQTRELFDLIVTQLGYTAPSNKVLGPIVKAHIINGDVNAAVAEFENLSNVHKSATPCRNELCIKLIEINDSERLQKVVDICVAAHGEANALHDLAGSFIEAGQLKQAQKIFETPGLRARQMRLDVICEHFLELKQVEKIAQMIECTKRLFEVDKEKLYSYLLRGYVQENDVQKALGVWDAMQEDDVAPSNKTLIFLAKFLKRNNQPVPFADPTEMPEFEDPDLVQEHPDLSINVLIRSGRIDEALQEKEKIEREENENLNAETTSKLIEALVKGNRLAEATNIAQELLARGQFPFVRVFRFLLASLAKGGDTENILALKALLPPEKMAVIRYHTHLSMSYKFSNRHLELMDIWEKNMGQSDVELPFSVGGFFGLLQFNPELEDRLLKLSERFAKEENDFKPLNMVWLHWMMKMEFDKAKEVFQRLQENSPDKFLYNSVIRHARETKNESISSELCNVAKASDLTSEQKGHLISCHLGVQLDNGKFDEALATLQEATSAAGVPINNLSLTLLRKLQVALQQQGKPFPFVIPTSRERRQDDTSSSSSDDEK